MVTIHQAQENAIQTMYIGLGIYVFCSFLAGTVFGWVLGRLGRSR